MSAARPRRTLLVILLAAAALCPSVRASTWELDHAATQVAFSVRNLSMAHVDGHFRLTSGAWARTATVRWIEAVSNHKRRHSAIDMLSPIAYEERHWNRRAAAYRR
jgi:transposase InsO family protein